MKAFSCCFTLLLLLYGAIFVQSSHDHETPPEASLRGRRLDATDELPLCADPECTPREECVLDSDLTPRCVCRAGFLFNEADRQCQDVDECDVDFPCGDPDKFFCVDMDPPFRFKCGCLEGLKAVLPDSDEGFTEPVPLDFRPLDCIDRNECEEDEDSCDLAVSTCTNLFGSFSCDCLENFERDPHDDKKCIAIEGAPPAQIVDLCGNHCRSENQQVCTDSITNPGTQACLCEAGFWQIREGSGCFDIDECSAPELNDCDVNANCHNIPGSFICTCADGFRGGGRDCRATPSPTGAPSTSPSEAPVVPVVENIQTAVPGGGGGGGIVPAPAPVSVLRSLVFNEILPDPSGKGDTNFDTDGDGKFEDEDEFLEVFNSGAAPLDISGLEFWDAVQDNYFTVPPGTILGPGGFLVIVNDVGSLPDVSAIVPSGSLPDVSEGSFAFVAKSMSLLNTGENLVIYDPVTDEFIQAIYNGALVDDPTDATEAFYEGFSTTATLIGSVLDFGDDLDGTSLALSPDGLTSNPVLHNTIGNGLTLASPGNSNIDTVEIFSVLNYLVFNEILPDPNSGSRNFDTDGNGVAENGDEFVEVFNTAEKELDISGLQFWDAGKLNYFTVPENSVLGAKGFLLVVGKIGEGGSLPTVNDAVSKAFSANVGSGIFNNGGDTLLLFDPKTDEFIQAQYNNGDNSIDDFDGLSPTATRIGNILDFGSDTDGVSLALSPDGRISGTSGNAMPRIIATSPAVKHNTIGKGLTLASPGKPNIDPALIIFTYIEGSGNDKALQLCNPTPQQIDLEGYSIEVFFNGQTSPGTIIPLTGIIAPAGVFTVADDDAGEPINNQVDPDELLLVKANLWSGNDPVVLTFFGSVVDSLGQIGNSADFGKDVILSRTGFDSDRDPTDTFDADVSYFDLGIDSVGVGLRNACVN